MEKNALLASLMFFMLVVFSVSAVAIENYPNNQISLYHVGAVYQTISDADAPSQIAEQDDCNTYGETRTPTRSYVKLSDKIKYDTVYRLSKHLAKIEDNSASCKRVILKDGINSRDLMNSEGYYRECYGEQPYHTLFSERQMVYENLGVPYFTTGN
ncbi:hypothetical protein H6503_01050 [Candidatus Woesearchaeota archaeon]|nr:hypothetical protein [Candidatus Woesearchaeota archaeon]